MPSKAEINDQVQDLSEILDDYPEAKIGTDATTADKVDLICEGGPTLRAQFAKEILHSVLEDDPAGIGDKFVKNNKLRWDDVLEARKEGEPGVFAKTVKVNEKKGTREVVIVVDMRNGFLSDDGKTVNEGRVMVMHAEVDNKVPPTIKQGRSKFMTESEYQYSISLAPKFGTRGNIQKWVNGEMTDKELDEKSKYRRNSKWFGAKLDERAGAAARTVPFVGQRIGAWFDARARKLLDENSYSAEEARLEQDMTFKGTEGYKLAARSALEYVQDMDEVHRQLVSDYEGDVHLEVKLALRQIDQMEADRVRDIRFKAATRKFGRAARDLGIEASVRFAQANSAVYEGLGRVFDEMVYPGLEKMTIEVDEKLGNTGKTLVGWAKYWVGQISGDLGQQELEAAGDVEGWMETLERQSTGSVGARHMKTPGGLVYASEVPVAPYTGSLELSPYIPYWMIPPEDEPGAAPAAEATPVEPEAEVLTPEIGPAVGETEPPPVDGEAWIEEVAAIYNFTRNPTTGEYEYLQ